MNKNKDITADTQRVSQILPLHAVDRLTFRKRAEAEAVDFSIPHTQKMLEYAKKLSHSAISLHFRKLLQFRHCDLVLLIDMSSHP